MLTNNMFFTCCRNGSARSIASDDVNNNYVVYSHQLVADNGATGSTDQNQNYVVSATPQRTSYATASVQQEPAYSDNYNLRYDQQQANPYNSAYNPYQGYNTNAYYYYYNNGQNSLQPRFHPTTFGHDHDHTGEVLEVLAAPTAVGQVQDQTQSGSENIEQDSFLQGSFTSDDFSQGSSEQDTYVQAASNDQTFAQSAPSGQTAYSYPPPSGGYDYTPPSPPPPPPPATEGYYYPPPSNQYLPARPPPPPPPPNQYLPVPPPTEETRQVTTDYTYYYLGPKLWYIPLFFSVYFVIYVAALIIKAVSKHKILLPQKLYDAASSVYQQRNGQNFVDELTSRVFNAITRSALKYMKRKLVY